MKQICDVLEVSRSNIIARTQQQKKRCSYVKNEDKEILPVILQLIDKRPTYGYRRIHAILNKIFSKSGKAPVNHKRIYRIMRQHGLLLQRYTGNQNTRTHNGKIITLKSNLRWCSDVFEIPCWNKEIIRVVFSFDCCDREIMSFIATTGWVNARMVQDLMTQTMEYRFGKISQIPQKIEWLTDNEKYYLAKDTIAFAREIGLQFCNTPAYSPQSNGMAEAFVKTFKRDYVFVNNRPNANAVLRQLADWFEDYNEYHPHKALKMLSPREYLLEARG